jgi:hypothetical protein
VLYPHCLLSCSFGLNRLKSLKIALSRGEFRRVTDSRNLDLVFFWQLYPYQPEAFLPVEIVKLINKLEVTIARQVLPYDQSHGVDYTNKRHLFKLHTV